LDFSPLTLTPPPPAARSTLPLHDALPISRHRRAGRGARARAAAQPDLRRTLLKRQEPRMPGARSLALAAVALVAVGGCRGGASGPKVTLRYHPPAGGAYHYALDQQNAMRIEGGPMSAMPEQTFRMRM